MIKSLLKKREDLPFEEIEHMAKDIPAGDLALLLHSCVYPSLAGKQRYKSAELWMQVDSEDFNRWKDAALQFIAQYEKVVNQ